MSLAAFVNGAYPSIGKYSLSAFESNANSYSILLTTLKIYGLPSSSLYAPTPKFIFFLSVSALNANAVPKMGSGGANFT